MKRLLPVLVVLSACSGDNGPPLVARNIEIAAPVPGHATSAGYLELQNNSGKDIVITRVESPQFRRVEMHRSSIENGIASMRPVDELAVPAGTAVILERGGLHLMLMGPSGAPGAVTLTFFAGDTVLLDVTAQTSAGEP